MIPAEATEDLPEEFAEQVAERLLSVEGEARRTALTELIAAHPEEEAALRALCRDLDGVDDLLETRYPDARCPPPRSIGGYRVLRCLGEGAFGVVYLCAQEQPVVREVAVKLLRPGVGDPHTIRRFASERQALATLNHPGITHVFDAGETDGQPWFAMEYVDGSPITGWCRERNTPTNERLQLFLALCRAVGHAHANGIVHRDLKPANVLVVATVDGPVPKVIDFGIAKALDRVDAHGPRTEAGRVIGTPGYMSPEQAGGRADEVDARADVFALGVMLYELLTDTLPWARGVTARDTGPVPPSIRVGSTDGTGAERANVWRRRAAALAGDLDWITLKALAHERDERYATVAEFAADVGRHLRGETVSVGPPSLRYRLRKKMRGQRAAFSWAAACVVVVLVAATIVWRLSGRAESSEAQRRTTVASAVARFRQRAVDAATAGAPEAVVRALVDDAMALRDLDPPAPDAATDRRQQRAELLADLAGSCHLIGAHREAIQFADEARRLADALLAEQPGGPAATPRALALRELGRCNFLLGDFAAAREHSERAIEAFEILAATAPLEHAMTLSGTLVEHAAACIRLGDAEAQTASQTRAAEVLASFVAQRADDEEAQRNLVRLHCGLANTRLARGNRDAAAAELRQAEHLVQTLPLVTDEEHALVDHRLAKFHAANGAHAQAIEVGERGAQRLVRYLETHPDRYQQRVLLVLLRELLFEQNLAAGHEAEAWAQADAVGAMPEGRAVRTRIPIGTTLLVMARRSMVVELRQDFERADALLTRAADLVSTLDDDREVAALHAEVLATRLHVRAELRRPESATVCDDVARLADAAQSREWSALAHVCACRRRLLDGDASGARRDLAALLRDPGNTPEETLTRLAVAVELAAADSAAIVRAVRQLVGRDPSPLARTDAAIACWRAHGWAQGADPDAIAVTADSATLASELCEQITDAAPQSTSLQRAHARLVLALLGADPARIAAELAILTRARDSALASAWHESLWCAAQVAVGRSGLCSNRGEAALSTLAAVVDLDRMPAESLDLAAACLTCRDVDPRLTASVTGLALRAIRRAVKGGLRGRATLLGRLDLAPIRAHPEFVELLTHTPD